MRSFFFAFTASFGFPNIFTSIIQSKNIEIEDFIMENYTFLVQAGLFLTVCRLWEYACYCELKGKGLTFRGTKRRLSAKKP